MVLKQNKAKPFSMGLSVSSNDTCWQQLVLPRGLRYRIAICKEEEREAVTKKLSPKPHMFLKFGRLS